MRGKNINHEKPEKASEQSIYGFFLIKKKSEKISGIPITYL